MSRNAKMAVPSAKMIDGGFNTAPFVSNPGFIQIIILYPAFNLLLKVVIVACTRCNFETGYYISSVPLVMSVIADLRELFITCQKHSDQLSHDS